MSDHSSDDSQAVVFQTDGSGGTRQGATYKSSEVGRWAYPTMPDIVKSDPPVRFAIVAFYCLLMALTSSLDTQRIGHVVFSPTAV